MTAIRHVVFDLDGTLFDSMSGIDWSAGKALLACGLQPLRHSLRPLLGPPIRTILAQATGISADARLDSLESAFRSSYDTEGWLRTVCYPGSRAALRTLTSSGLRLWVATNKLRNSTRKILAALAIESFFDEVVCRDSRVPSFLSKAEMLKDLLVRRALPADHCLMVGDTLEDVRASRAAGIRCVLVPHAYGTGLPAELRISGWNDLLHMCAPRVSTPPEDFGL